MKKPIPEYIIYDWEKVHLACESGDLIWLKQLLDKGIDKNIKNDTGFTPIMSAIIEQELEVIDFLISQDVFIDGESLIKSIYTDNKTIIEKILNTKVNLNYISGEGWNILIHLIVNGNDNIFNWFIDNYRLEINHIDKKGLTPIFHSSGLGYIQMTEKLIKLGANLNHKTYDGITLLDWCDEMIVNPNVEHIRQMIINATQHAV